MAQDGSMTIRLKIDVSNVKDEIKAFEKKDLKSTVKSVKEGFEGAFDAAGKAAKTFGNVASKIGDGVKKVFAATTKIITGIGAALVAAAGVGVAYNAEMEDYITSFTTMLGTAEASAALVEDLKKTAASTPFEMGDLANATKTLLAFGSTADEVMDQVSMLGDISLGNAEKMGTLSTAFGRIQSNGRASMEEINMMIDAGFNPLNIIAAKTGETMEDLRKRVSDGSLSYEELAEAMKIATSEGGQFYKGMENASKTFNGMMSTIKDNARALVGSMTNDIFGELSATFLPQVIGWLDQIQTAFNKGGIQGAITAAGDVVGQFITQIITEIPNIISTATMMIESFIGALSANADTLVLAAGAILGGLAQAFMTVAPMLAEIALQLMTSFAGFISDNAAGVTQAMVDSVMGFGDWITNNGPAIGQTVVNLFNILIDFALALIPNLLETAKTILQTIGQFLTDNAGMIGYRIGDCIASMIKWLSDNADQLLFIGMQIIAGITMGIVTAAYQIIGALMTEVVGPCLELLIKFAGTIGIMIFDAFKGIWVSIEQIIDSIVQVFVGLIRFIVDIFTGDWKGAWQNIVDIFGAIFSGLGAILKAPLNAVIGLINGAISGLNMISVDIPDWVPGFGGTHFGISIPKIPYLAQGAVIPPNNPYLAVVGDQTSGTNIETPLATMIDAFNRALDARDGSGGTYVINVILSGKQIYSEVVRQDELQKIATGKSAFAE